MHCVSSHLFSFGILERLSLRTSIDHASCMHRGFWKLISIKTLSQAYLFFIHMIVIFSDAGLPDSTLKNILNLLSEHFTLWRDLFSSSTV